MKIIKEYQNGYYDIEAESAVESLYEKGDYIEVDFKDYYVFDYEVIDGKHIYQTRRVV